MQKTLTICLAATALLLAAASPAQGAITVANQNDSGPGSLRQAIAEAPPGETINVPAGTYTLTSGPLKIEKSVTVSGHGAGDTVLRSGAPFRVIEIGSSDVTISGVTIRDGVVTPGPAFGAGLVAINANLTLRSVTVTNNRANANGIGKAPGGVAQGGGVLSLGGHLTLTDSTVSNNSVTAVGGEEANGGTAAAGGVGSSVPVTIVNSTISGNLVDARGGQGPANEKQDGGIAVAGGLLISHEDPGTSSVAGTTVSGNVADSSGGPGGSTSIAEGGGVVVITEKDRVVFANTTIASNLARGLSGGSPGGIVVAGGMLVNTTASSPVEVLSSTIAANRLEGSAASLETGGNLAVSGAARVGNSIIANGVGPANGENCGGIVEGLTSLGFNLESLNQCGFKAAGDRVNTDPQLGPLQSNGGLTQTMAPALSSPAIDQGNSLGITADQRGVLRPIDLPTIPNASVAGANGADIGAVEFQPSNALTVGKLKKNKKKGTATLTVNLPQPSVGVLTLEGKGLKKQTKQVAGEGQVKLKVLPTGKVKKALRKKGKRKVGIKVKYTPTGNTTGTASRKTKLVKKKKRKKG